MQGETCHTPLSHTWIPGQQELGADARQVLSRRLQRLFHLMFWMRQLLASIMLPVSGAETKRAVAAAQTRPTRSRLDQLGKNVPCHFAPCRPTGKPTAAADAGRPRRCPRSCRGRGTAMVQIVPQHLPSFAKASAMAVVGSELTSGWVKTGPALSSASGMQCTHLGQATTGPRICCRRYGKVSIDTFLLEQLLSTQRKSCQKAVIPDAKAGKIMPLSRVAMTLTH